MSLVVSPQHELLGLTELSEHHDINPLNLKSIKPKFEITVTTFLGVEGSGHHLFQQFLRNLAKQNHANVAFDEGTCDWRKGINRIMNHAKKYVKRNETMPQTLFLITHACSYPFGDFYQPKNLIPGLTDAVEKINDDTQQNIYINLRFIVLKRDYVCTLASSCYHRFGACPKRVETQYQGFKLIDQGLKSIDQKYWIIIDYFDICKQPNQYINILSKWLNIDDEESVKYALSLSKPPKENAIEICWNEIKTWDITKTYTCDKPKCNYQWDINHHPQKLPKDFSLEKQLLTNFSIYNLKDSVWFSDCAVVNPENQRFIDQPCNS